MANSKVCLSALEPVIEYSIPIAKQSENDSNYIRYGVDNKYPNFLYDLYLNSPTLMTVINGTADYIIGNGLTFLDGSIMANATEKIEDVVKKVAIDYLIFGYGFLEVIENGGYIPSEFYHIDSRFLRTDKYWEGYWYNENFAKKYTSSNKTVVIPKYVKGNGKGIVMFRNPAGRDTYPQPLWSACIKNALTEVEIQEFHLSSIRNGFSPSTIISFNNGIPTDEQKKEIEDAITEKFAGSANAAKVMLAFNQSKDNAVEVQTIAPTDFSQRYEQLSKNTEYKLYNAFGANPNLFGVHTENNGFNSEEYEQTFKLFNKTRIVPIQKMFINAFESLDKKITIEPFSL